LRAFAVAGGIQWIEHLGGELGRLFEDRVDGVRRRVLEPGKPGDLLEAGKLAQDEADLRERRAIGAHPSSAVSAGMISNRSPTRP
jgi:hypothetical protein